MNKKLLDTFYAFNPIELNQLKQFIHSDFVNKNQKVCKLFEFLINNKREDLTYEKINSHLFPNSKTTETQKTHNYASLLYDLLCRFLVWKNLQQKSMLSHVLLLEELRARNLYNNFEKELNLPRKGNTDDIRNDKHNYYQFAVSEQEDLYFLQLETRKQSDSLQKKNDALDIYYFSSKLKCLCDMINRKNIIKIEFKRHFEREIINYIQTHSKAYMKHPSIKMYFLIYQLLVETNQVSDYYKYKNELFENYIYFPLEEKKDLFGYAQNYCIRKVNHGNKEFLNELFELYNFQLENEILITPFLKQSTYKTIVALGLRLQKNDWTENFIEKYAKDIQKEHRENAYYFNKATFYYSIQKTKQALLLLQNVRFTDVYYNTDARTLMIRIYFEQNDHEALTSAINNFKSFLKRNKLLSKGQITLYNQFITYVKRIYAIKEKSILNENYLEQLPVIKQKILNNKNTVLGNWLINKIDECFQ